MSGSRPHAPTSESATRQGLNAPSSPAPDFFDAEAVWQIEGIRQELSENRHTVKQSLDELYGQVRLGNPMSMTVLSRYAHCTARSLVFLRILPLTDVCADRAQVALHDLQILGDDPRKQHASRQRRTLEECAQHLRCRRSCEASRISAYLLARFIAGCDRLVCDKLLKMHCPQAHFREDQK